jgi:hypothetical protein
LDECVFAQDHAHENREEIVTIDEALAQDLTLALVHSQDSEGILDQDQDRDNDLTDITQDLGQEIAVKADLPRDSEVVTGQKTDLASRFKGTYCTFS